MTDFSLQTPVNPRESNFDIQNMEDGSVITTTNFLANGTGDDFIPLTVQKVASTAPGAHGGSDYSAQRRSDLNKRSQTTSLNTILHAGSQAGMKSALQQHQGSGTGIFEQLKHP